MDYARDMARNNREQAISLPIAVALLTWLLWLPSQF